MSRTLIAAAHAANLTGRAISKRAAVSRFAWRGAGPARRGCWRRRRRPAAPRAARPAPPEARPGSRPLPARSGRARCRTRPGRPPAGPPPRRRRCTRRRVTPSLIRVSRARSLGAAVAQMVDRGADLLQRDAGVEQALDHLEHEDVAEAVEPLRARPVRRPDAGLHQAGPRPVVELAVGDPGGGAGGRAAVADVLGVGGEVVPEQQALLAGALDRGAALLRLAAVLAGYRHARLRPGSWLSGYLSRTLGRPARRVNDPHGASRQGNLRLPGRSPPD